MAITQKPNGRFFVHVKRLGVYLIRRTVDSQKEAEDLEARTLAKYNRGVDPEQIADEAKVTLGSLYQDCLKEEKFWRSRGEDQAKNAVLVISMLNDSMSPFEINREVCQMLVTEWQRIGNSPKTINKKLNALKRVLDVGVFLDYYQAHDVFDPMKCSLAVDDSGRREAMPETEVGAFRRQLDREDVTTKAFFELMLSVGGRVSEHCQIEVQDLDLEAGLIRLLAGKKRGARNERWVPLRDQALAAICSHIDETGPYQCLETPVFNPVDWGNDDKVRYRFKKVAKAAGLRETYTPHTLRHTCATRLLRAGANIYAAKQWLGHERIETTLQYITYDPTMLDEAIQRMDKYEAAI